MNACHTLNRFERLLSLFTRVQPGEGRCIAILSLQACTLMMAWYLIRPVREALILTEGGAEFRSYAVAVQALLLIAVIPIYGALVRRVDASRVYQRVNAFFVFNLLVFSLLCRAGWPIGFVFFVWASLFGVMALTQFWAFATDLFDVKSGQRLFGVIAIGVSGGALIGSRIAASLFGSLGSPGLMLVSAAALVAAIALSGHARVSVPLTDRSADVAAAHAADTGTEGPGRWLGGFMLIGRSRYLIGIAALVVLLNWITTTGDFVLSSWLVDIAGRESPADPGAYIGKFMGEYCSYITLIAFLVQLLLVSRIIEFAGVARALVVTPLAFVAGYLLVGIVPVFLMLQSVLVVQRSFDYSLLSTTRNALLLPTSRAAKYQAKTAIDTFFYRLGDLLSSASVYVGVQFFAGERLRFLWLIVVLSVTMAIVAWLVGREYARRTGVAQVPAGVGVHVRGRSRTILFQ